MSKLCDLQIHINDEETFFLYEVYTLKDFIIVIYFYFFDRLLLFNFISSIVR
jgi:hypothetical protein